MSKRDILWRIVAGIVILPICIYLGLLGRYYELQLIHYLFGE